MIKTKLKTLAAIFESSKMKMELLVNITLFYFVLFQLWQLSVS